jgi:hypothetical protein
VYGGGDPRPSLALHAIEVLNEFPGYGEAFAARQAGEQRDQ